MNKLSVTIACTALVSILAGTAAATMLDVSDIDMHPSDWAAISKFNPITIVAGAPIANKPSLAISTSGQLWAAIYKKAAIWDPSILGAIDTVECSADFVINSGITFSPVLVQGTNVYATPGIPPYFQEPQNFGVPQGLAWSLPISLFGKETGSGPDRPDFSPGAPPIQLAIAGRHDPTNGAAYRFGNVHFHVTGMVPEPETLWLAAVVIPFGVYIRRRLAVQRRRAAR